jgi:hypothetical protein
MTGIKRVSRRADPLFLLPLKPRWQGDGFCDGLPDSKMEVMAKPPNVPKRRLNSGC